MKIVTVMPILFFAIVQPAFAQKKTDGKKEIIQIIDAYSESVIKRDSATFYNLFNKDAVTWCLALRERSQSRELGKRSPEIGRSNYSSGSHKGFFRSLYRHGTTEDKFDNIAVVEDGTVASVTMDYSFWADGKMTNWGAKYLTLIKRDGQWKITSVIYSIELTEYFPQPALKERQK